MWLTEFKLLCVFENEYVLNVINTVNALCVFKTGNVLSVTNSANKGREGGREEVYVSNNFNPCMFLRGQKRLIYLSSHLKKWSVLHYIHW